ncbi:MAG: hypothetical protein R3Y23_04150 [Bacillota bacterium]
MWVEDTKNYKEQTANVIKHIMDEIERAGKALPQHKFVPYSEDSYTKEEKAIIKKRKAEELKNK